MDGVVDEPFELLLCRGGILGALREVAGGGAEAGGQVVELGYERAEALGEALEIARHGAGGAARGRARCGLPRDGAPSSIWPARGVGELLQAPAMPLDRLLCLGKAGREVAHLRIGRIEGAVDGVLYITHAREAPRDGGVPRGAGAGERVGNVTHARRGVTEGTCRLIGGRAGGAERVAAACDERTGGGREARRRRARRPLHP